MIKAKDLAAFLLRHPDATVDVSVDMSTDAVATTENRVFADVIDFLESRGEVTLICLLTAKNYKD